jgi:hypothetical protein
MISSFFLKRFFYFLCIYYKMIGGRKVRSNKGKRRGSYSRGTGSTRSGAKFRGRNLNSNKSKKARKVRSNKGKRRSTYRRGSGRTRSGKKFRGGANVLTTHVNVSKMKKLFQNKSKQNHVQDKLALEGVRRVGKMTPMMQAFEANKRAEKGMTPTTLRKEGNVATTVARPPPPNWLPPPKFNN